MIDGWAADDVTPPAFMVTTEEKVARSLLRFLIKLGEEPDSEWKEKIMMSYSMQDIADLCDRCNIQEETR